jgi:hypothetical protein
LELGGEGGCDAVCPYFLVNFHPLREINMTVSGRCLCEAVRYDITGNAVFAAKCHCRDCQKLSGSGYMFVIAYPEDSVTITGPMTYYEKVADNGMNVHERYCGDCSSRIGARCDSMPGLVLIAAGSLDDPDAASPEMEIFTAKANHWDLLDESLPKFEGMPPME